MNLAKLFLDGPFDPSRFIALYHSGRGRQERQQATSDFGQQGKLTGAAQETLGQFEGPVEESPFYRALRTSGIENTSNAYNNARSNMRQRANMAGFGYNQPVEQGGENQLDAREASALAAVPREAMIEATGPALEAAGQSGRMGMGYGAQGTTLLQGRPNPLWQALQAAGQTAASGIGAYYGGK